LVFGVKHIFELPGLLLITVFFLNSHRQLHLEMLFVVMPCAFLVSLPAFDSHSELINKLCVVKCPIAWIQ